MRRMIFTLPLAVLITAAASGNSALAAPLSTPPAIAADTSIIKVGGCHNRTHVHYVPEWGFTTAHHHKGPYCRPVQDENDIPQYHRFDGPTLYFNFDDDYRDHQHHRRHHPHHDDY